PLRALYAPSSKRRRGALWRRGGQYPDVSLGKRSRRIQRDSAMMTRRESNARTKEGEVPEALRGSLTRAEGRRRRRPMRQVCHNGVESCRDAIGGLSTLQEGQQNI